MAKRPRRRHNPGENKTPRVDISKTPQKNKSPRTAVVPHSIEREKPSWGLKIIEREGPFGWGRISNATLWEKILSKLGNFETMTWAEIKHQKNNHHIDVNKLSSIARERLKTIQQDDVDQVFSFHLEGRLRVVGITEGAKFKILWYDPEHGVCPSKKKHT
jgi:hypothetical protein